MTTTVSKNQNGSGQSIAHTLLEINDVSCKWYAIILAGLLIVNLITNRLLARIGIPISALILFVSISVVMKFYPTFKSILVSLASNIKLPRIVPKAVSIRLQSFFSLLLNRWLYLEQSWRIQLVRVLRYFFIGSATFIIVYQLSSTISFVNEHIVRYPRFDKSITYLAYLTGIVGILSIILTPFFTRRGHIVKTSNADPSQSHYITTRILYLLLFSGFVYHLIQIFSGPLGPDDGHIIYELFLTSQGFIPFKDFQTQGLLFDLLFFPTMLLPKIGNWYFTYRFLNLGLTFGILFVLYKIATLYNKKIYPLVFVYFLLAPPYLFYRYNTINAVYLMTLFYALALYFSLKFLDKGRKKYLFVASLLILGAGLSRASAFFYGIFLVGFALFYQYGSQLKMGLQFLRNIKYKKIEAIFILLGVILLGSIILFYNKFSAFTVFDTGIYILRNIFLMKKNVIGGYAGWNISILKELGSGQIYILIPLIIFFLKFLFRIKDKVIRSFSVIYLASFVVILIFTNITFNYNPNALQTNAGQNNFLDLFFHQIGYIFILYVGIRALAIFTQKELHTKVKNILYLIMALIILTKNAGTIKNFLILYNWKISLFIIGIAATYMIVLRLKRWKSMEEITVFERALFVLICAFLVFYTYIYSGIVATYFAHDVSFILSIISGIILFQLIKTAPNISYGAGLLVVFFVFSFFYPIYRNVNTPYSWQSVVPPIRYYNEAVTWLKKQSYIGDEIFTGYPLFAVSLDVRNVFNISHVFAYENYPVPNFVRARYHVPSEKQLIAYLQQHPEILFIDEPTGRLYIRPYLKKLDLMLESEYCVVKNIGGGYIKIYRYGTCREQQL